MKDRGTWSFGHLGNDGAGLEHLLVGGDDPGLHVLLKFPVEEFHRIIELAVDLQLGIGHPVAVVLGTTKNLEPLVYDAVDVHIRRRNELFRILDLPNLFDSNLVCHESTS